MTTALGWVRGQRHAPAALYPQEGPGSHCTGGWVGPRAGLDRCGKPRPHRDSIPEPSSPVASRYTDYATRPTHLENLGVNGKHTNMDLQEIVWEGVDWIFQAQDREEW